LQHVQRSWKNGFPSRRVYCIDDTVVKSSTTNYKGVEHTSLSCAAASRLIELNIGMRGRVEIEEVGMDAQVESLIAKQQGAELDEEADSEAVTEKEVEVVLRQVAAVQFGPQRREHTASLLLILLKNSVLNCSRPALKRRAHRTKGAEAPWNTFFARRMSPVHRASCFERDD